MIIRWRDRDLSMGNGVSEEVSENDAWICVGKQPLRVMGPGLAQAVAEWMPVRY